MDFSLNTLSIVHTRSEYMECSKLSDLRSWEGVEQAISDRNKGAILNPKIAASTPNISTANKWNNLKYYHWADLVLVTLLLNYDILLTLWNQDIGLGGRFQGVLKSLAYFKFCHWKSRVGACDATWPNLQRQTVSVNNPPNCNPYVDFYVSHRPNSLWQGGKVHHYEGDSRYCLVGDVGLDLSMNMNTSLMSIGLRARKPR